MSAVGVPSVIVFMSIHCIPEECHTFVVTNECTNEVQSLIIGYRECGLFMKSFASELTRTFVVIASRKHKCTISSLTAHVHRKTRRHCHLIVTLCEALTNHLPHIYL